MWDSPNLIPIVNVLGLGLLGAIAALGHWWGKKRPPETMGQYSPVNMTKIDGALVDSASVKVLAASIEAVGLQIVATGPGVERRHAEIIAMADRFIDAIDNHARVIQANTDESKEQRWSKK